MQKKRVKKQAAGKVSQLVKINSALNRIEKEEKSLGKEEKRIEEVEKKIEKQIDSISKEEKTIENSILCIGRINIKKRHLLDLISASAGAFLGVGIGRGLIGLDGVARNLSWLNVFGILAFILAISALLIYRDQRIEVQTKGKSIIFTRLTFTYLVSLFIELISLFLFNVPYDSLGTLIKIMIVGSYTAMASAVTFSIIK